MLSKRFKILFLVAVSGFILWFLIGFYCSVHMTSRRKTVYKVRPDKLKAEAITLKTEDNISISAWYKNTNSDKAVILLAGIGADRMSNISRAEYYLANGYSVLLPDLRCTGSSGGEVITFGWNESKDLKACYEFLRRKNSKKIGVHGCSLGAATITYSLKDIKDYHFIVLESCYDNIDQAFENRVEKFHLPDFVYFPVRFFIEKRMGVKTKELKPEEFIKLAKSPVLIMAGDAEDQIKISETQKLFDNCTSGKKMLCFFRNGKHEDFMDKFKEKHTDILDFFIRKYAGV
jgi:esterase/lipase